LKDELRKWVSKEIGSLAARRYSLHQACQTRSGKIMRRLLRELATHGEIQGDTTTLEDFTSSPSCARLRKDKRGFKSASNRRASS